MKLTYTKIGDYYLPNIIATEPKIGENIGKYGILRLIYLKQNKKVEYLILRAKNKLYEHLLEVETECKERIKSLVNEMVTKEKVDEKLKEKNQLQWTKMMKNIKNVMKKFIIF